MTPNPSITTVAVASAAGLLGTAYVTYYLYQKQKRRLPDTWTRVGTLSDIIVYPIKSCGPIRLETAECTILGLKDAWLQDRALMVVDKDNNFVTARIYSELYMVQPIIHGSVLTLKHKDMEDIRVNLAEVVALKKPEKATVWGITVPVRDCGWEVSEWFSRLLAQKTHEFKLMYYASENCRSVGTEKFRKYYKYTKNDCGAFPDDTSYNLVNDASVQDLNQRLETPITYDNFRPNFVLKGAKPYEEDKWKFVKIGQHVFEIKQPCTRCVMTTMDPETGVRHPDAEPLKTLRSYRLVENPEERHFAGTSPKMGLQMTLRSQPGGHVSLNDDVFVA